MSKYIAVGGFTSDTETAAPLIVVLRWDGATFEEVNRYMYEAEDYAQAINIDFAKDGKHILASYIDSDTDKAYLEVFKWDAPGMESIGKLTIGDFQSTDNMSVQINPYGQVIAHSLSTNKLRIAKFADSKLYHLDAFFPITDGISMLSWSPNGQHMAILYTIVSTTTQYRVAILKWNGESITKVADSLVYDGTGTVVTSIAFSPNGKHVAISYRSAAWGAFQIYSWNGTILALAANVYPSLDAKVAHLAWSPSGSHLAATMLTPALDPILSIFSWNESTEVLTVSTFNSTILEPISLTWSGDTILMGHIEKITAFSWIGTSLTKIIEYDHGELMNAAALKILEYDIEENELVFDGKKSTDPLLGIVSWTNWKRSVLPDTEDKFLQIPGTDGVVDFGTNLKPREIICDFVVNKPTRAELRRAIRKLADWLRVTATRTLVLGDEPDKAYMARPTGTIDLEEIVTTGRGTVNFTVTSPYSEALIQQTETVFPIYNRGTVETPCTIEIIVSSAPTTVLISTLEETGEYIRLTFPLSLSENDVVIIDTEKRKITINGFDARLSLDIDSTYFKLPVGEVTITTSPTPKKVTLRYKERWK